MKNFVITIGRQTGSGGREIAERLASRLGIRYYDKEALMELAQQTDSYEEVQSFYEEQPVDSLLYAIAMENFEANIANKPFESIRRVCAKEPCILLGRCGNYIFRDEPDTVRIFLCSGRQNRVQRLMESYGLERRKAELTVRNTDKARESFHRYYTHQEWGKAEHYDLCIDALALSLDNTVDFLMDYLRYRGMV